VNPAVRQQRILDLEIWKNLTMPIFFISRLGWLGEGCSRHDALKEVLLAPSAAQFLGEGTQLLSGLGVPKSHLSERIFYFRECFLRVVYTIASAGCWTTHYAERRAMIDWQKDMQIHPPEIQAMWINLMCFLWWCNPPGQATLSLTQWSQVLGLAPLAAKNRLEYLLQKNIASAQYLDNQNITIISRRMVRDYEIRQLRQKVGSLGSKTTQEKIRQSLLKQTVEQNDEQTPKLSVSKEKKDIMSASEVEADSIPYDAIVGYLNDVAGTKYLSTIQKTRALIRARIKEDFTLDDFETVIDSKVQEWGEDPVWRKYLRPQTLFGTKFGHGKAPSGGTFHLRL
jgi:uncharacterized phage protein (TIGR02220 family)